MAANRRALSHDNGPINAETFRFLRELNRNNRKEWMDENRERYKSAVVQPFRALLEKLTPAVTKLYPGIDVSGRSGVNFSRINRDIRFAKDKTPYHPRMYLLLPPRGGKRRLPGELYLGVAARIVTAGFRVYFDRETKAAALSPRIGQAHKWCAQQKRRMPRQYESYWYSMEKGAWTKNHGWPVAAEDWKKLRAWIVRKKISAAAAVRPGFEKQVTAIFGEVLPLLRFVSQSNSASR